MHEADHEPMRGEVEADETFVGGNSQNMHAWKRKKLFNARDGRIHADPRGNKAIVLGMLERSTRKIRAQAIVDRTRDIIHTNVRDAVQPGASIYTDAWHSYRGLSPEHVHQISSWITPSSTSRAHPHKRN